MKIEFLRTRNPYCVLGVPSFANGGQIRTAYRKRVSVLHLYRFDKATHPIEWRIVSDMLCELTEAYVQARSSDCNGNGHSTAPTTLLDKDRPAKGDNHDHAPVNVEKECYTGAEIIGRP